MKRDGWPLLAGAMLVVGAGAILLHWLLGRGMFPWLLGVYVAADRGGKHFLGGMIDNVAPALVLGWINGWVGYPRWSVRTLCATTFALAVFVVALMPLYRPLVGSEHFTTVWGSPSSIRELGVSYTFRIVSAFLVAGFFTRAAYVFRRDWKPRASSPGIRP